MAKQLFTTPVGRLVAGSCYKEQTTDADGNPLVIKRGPQAGQPRVEYFIALAIPKTPDPTHWSQTPWGEVSQKVGETHWSQTPWGEVIQKVGREAFPQGQWQHPTFAWKITDGDSSIPNKSGRRPCDKEGYPGHWVLHFSSGFAPRVYNSDGTQVITEPDAVKLGYYVQIAGSVDSNGSTQQPGVYLNHSMVALAAFGPEIIKGPDPRQVGFGVGVQLPAGASTAPTASNFNPAPPVTPVPVAPSASATLPAPSAPTVTGSPSSPPAVPVVPHPAFLNIPKPAGRTMTAKANGASYEQLIDAGWTEALLIEHGLMAA